MKFVISTLGCKINQADSREVAKLLVDEGLSPWNSGSGSRSGREKGPDLVVVNTCAVTQKAVAKSWRQFRALKRKYPKAFFVLAGCFPAIYFSKARELSADFIWKGPIGKEAGKEIVGRFFSFKKINQPNKKKENRRMERLITFQERSRYFLKIQDGCGQFCSYCVIPYTRGKPKSRKEEEIIKEAQLAGQSGFREIVVSGIHLGFFGKEKEKLGSRKKTTGNFLARLLEKLCQIEEIARIRLSSIEINDIDADLLEVIAKNRKICRHFHIPLQSGSNRILKKMNRPYNRQFFLEKISKIRKILPEAVFSTDVMVGFPGESELDFKKSCDLVKKIGFVRVHVFPFSSHQLTPAGKMKNKIPQAEIKERARILRGIGAILAEKFRNSCQGEKAKIIIERIEKGEVVGKAENYLEVRTYLGRKKISQLGIKKGQMIEVTIGKES